MHSLCSRVVPSDVHSVKRYSQNSQNSTAIPRRTTYRTIATAATKGSLSEETSIAIAKLGTQFIIVDTSVHFSAANIALLMGAVGSADGIISNDILGACTATSVHKYSRVIANDIVKDGVEVVEVA